MDINFLFPTSDAVFNWVNARWITLGMWVWAVKYVTAKTPWTWDDDLAPMMEGLLGRIKNGKAKS